MKEMLSGLSMDAQAHGTTFSNIYTSEGIALTDTVLGGLAVEENAHPTLSPRGGL